MEEIDKEERRRRCYYCVTGGGGYIGSWLVKSLLLKGYTVHATLRNPNPANSLHLTTLWGANDRLRIFKADLLEQGSFDQAVQGCIGVFHVAASMDFKILEKENVDSYVQSNIIDPAIKGTLNLLNACLKSKSVKRVVFTSSISTLTAKDGAGNWKDVVDETCQTPVEHVWNTKASGWVYVLSKLLTEEAAFQFAKDKGLDLVSVITTTVAGPFLTPTIPSSIRVLLSPLTGDAEFFSILSSVSSRMGSIALVHIEDICGAHIFLMEHSNAQGRYICCKQSCEIADLIHRLAKAYPCSNIHRHSMEEQSSVPCKISSKKLRDLGFTYKFGPEDIIHATIDCCKDKGFLPSIY